jgi:hypothetical protein
VCPRIREIYLNVCRVNYYEIIILGVAITDLCTSVEINSVLIEQLIMFNLQSAAMLQEELFSAAPPAIYVRTRMPKPLTMTGRLAALVLACGALAVLWTAATIVPAESGMGTHMQLGMQPCGFLQQTGWPCAACGMTTSFSHFVRGQLLTSFFTQPFGFVLALLTAAFFWCAAYCGITGRASYRLLKIIPLRAHLWIWIPLAFAAWFWKIACVAAGR